VISINQYKFGFEILLKMSHKKNLWDIAISQYKDKEKQIKDDEDHSNISCSSFMLVCGAKECGKTTMIQRFQDRDENTKPTIALDFCYLRKSKQNNMTTVKDVSQMWELGGGATMSKLIDVVITPKNIHKMSVVIMLDISQPNLLWGEQHILLSQLKERVATVIKEISLTDRQFAKDLKAKAWERVGKNHQDKNLMTPFEIPLVIVGAKYDDFVSEISNDKKEMIVRTLRFLAHSNGAMLQFYSHKADGMNKQSKQMLSHLAFNAAINKTASHDKNKPIVMYFGQDSFEQIGAPPVSSEALMKITRGGAPYDLWKAAFLSTFPAKNEAKNSKNNPTLDKQFADAMVDEMRNQKDQELDRYRKLCQRKAKEANLNANVGKVVKDKKKR